jgi:hypothetical protein
MPPADVPSLVLDHAEASANNEASSGPTFMITPSSIEVLAPLPVEQEKSISKVLLYESVEVDVGDTVDILLN